MSTTIPAVTAAEQCVGRLWAAVADGDEAAAVRSVLDAYRAGLDPETLLLDVIGAVQRRVGSEWAANRFTVTQEHAATSINDRVIAALSQAHEFPEPHLGRITVSCVDGEWHALPARLLSEVLRLRGFRVDYLGAQVPGPHLIAHLHRTGPDAVALSGSIATRLPTAHATITACQAAGIPVIAGGAAFGPDGRYARQFGAQAWAPDARSAADRLTSPLPRPHEAHQPIDDLPHLGDQEYTMISRSSRQLVQTMYVGLEERIPAMRDYTELQHQYAAEDLAHIVNFLASAVYTGDSELFTSFIVWTAEVLEARGVPTATLSPSLDLLGTELRDFPRAMAMIQEAGTALAAKIQQHHP
jgi:methanogenic corrinoid protein MtbC1